MELRSCTYATVTTLGDFGPWISKVVLDLPCTVRANDVDTAASLPWAPMWHSRSPSSA